MNKSQDPIENIVEHIKNKSVIKQKTYNNLLTSFDNMLTKSGELVENINQRISDVDKDVTVAIEVVSPHEFQLKVAGDMLVFFLHTNIVTFNNEHAVMKNKYILENPNRRYFGQIMIYNFMADSIKYNRLNDPGYLVARLLINYENHFLVEGQGQLDFLFKKVSEKIISPLDLDVIIKLAITEAAQSDLITKPFQEVRRISLIQKMEKNSHLGAGEKIGFKMSYQDNSDTN